MPIRLLRPLIPKVFVETTQRESKIHFCSKDEDDFVCVVVKNVIEQNYVKVKKDLDSKNVEVIKNRNSDKVRNQAISQDYVDVKNEKILNSLNEPQLKENEDDSLEIKPPALSVRVPQIQSQVNFQKVKIDTSKLPLARDFSFFKEAQASFMKAIENLGDSQKGKTFSEFCQSFKKNFYTFCQKDEIELKQAMKNVLDGISYLIEMQRGKSLFCGKEEAPGKVMNGILWALFAIEPCEQGAYIISDPLIQLTIKKLLTRENGFYKRVSSHCSGKTLEIWGMDGTFPTNKGHCLIQLITNQDGKMELFIRPEDEGGLDILNKAIWKWKVSEVIDFVFHSLGFFKSQWRKHIKKDNGEGFGYHKEHLLKSDKKKILNLQKRVFSVFSSKENENIKKKIEVFGLSKAIRVFKKFIAQITELEIKAKESEIDYNLKELGLLKKDLTSYVLEVEKRKNFHPQRNGNEIRIDSFRELLSLDSKDHFSLLKSAASKQFRRT